MSDMHDVPVGRIPQLNLGSGRRAAASAVADPVPEISGSSVDVDDSNLLVFDGVEADVPVVSSARHPASPPPQPSTGALKSSPLRRAMSMGPVWKAVRPARPFMVVLQALGALVVLLVLWWLRPMSGGDWLIGLALVAWYLYVAVVQVRVSRLCPVRQRPKLGARVLIYFVLRTALISYTPHPGAHERYSIRQLETKELCSVRSGEYVVVNPKGGVGKSTVLAAIGYELAKATLMPTLLVDARHDPGSVGGRVGLWPRENPLLPQPFTTVTLRQTIELYKGGWLVNPVQSWRLIGRRDDVPLFAISADMESTDFIVVADFRATMDVLARQFPLVLHESFNAVKTPLDLELMRRARPIFVHQVGMSESRTLLSKAIVSYTSHSKALKDKIERHAILFVLGTRRGDTPEKYSEMFHGKIPPGRVILVPYSRYFRGDQLDPGQTEPSLVNLSRRPVTTISLPDMPHKFGDKFLEGFNISLTTTPVRALNQIPVVPEDKESTR